MTVRIDAAAMAALLFAAAMGCSQEERIREYTVAKEIPGGPAPAVAETADDRPLEQPLAVDGPERLLPVGSDRPDEAPEALLGAVVPAGDTYWFFKAVGPVERIAAEEAPFVALLRSIEFRAPDGRPAWQTPESWRERPGAGMRFATFEFGPADEVIEMTVIPLGRGSMGHEEYMRANLNRWRAEMGLPPEPESGAAEFTAYRVGGAAAAAAVLYRGKRSAGTMKPPMMSGPAGGDPAAAPPPSPPPGPSAPQVSYQAPSGWKELPAGGMRKAAWIATGDDGDAEVTIIALPAFGGDVLANVNRWREQLRLPRTTREALDDELMAIAVDGRPGQYVVLFGPESAEGREALLGAIVPTGEHVWFVTLKGEAGAAERERETFESFVRSLRFGEAEGADDDGS